MANSYNHHEFGSYSPVPELSPYSEINDGRLNDPKFIFRFMLNEVRKWEKFDSVNSWTDVGCANGEFLHFLSQSEPDWSFTGLDINSGFLEVARQVLKNFSNVALLENDILAGDSGLTSDVVSCSGTFQIFPEPTAILNSLLDIVSPNGLLLIDGCFNPCDISMVVRYLDESKSEADDLWRCDFNHHSEKMIRRILSSRSDIASISFHYPVMDTEIIKEPGAPQINMWTEPRQGGGFNILNGMGWYFNPRFLVIEKF
jgi:ubiquinone/menaquinone biosynthesis C-methylase UbiE